MQRFLIKYEIRQIQKYIYGSSKIKEIVGASNLVRDCLKRFLIEACCDDELKLRQNIEKEFENISRDAFKFDENLDFQIGYEGGGNLSCFLKGDEEKVKKFNRKIGLLFLKETYSLRVSYAYVKVTDDFSKDRVDLDNLMSNLKMRASTCNLQGALPIVMTSSESSLPLSEKSRTDGKRKITRESRLKLDKYDEDSGGALGAIMIDDFVEKNVDSYIAIIHIDANDLGIAISNFFKSKNSDASYEEKVTLSREISNKIKAKYNDSFMDYLREFVNGHEKNSLRYRIIVNSGDDITLIFSKDYAIELVKGFLEKVNNDSFFDNDIRISACVGIAFVKAHFPYDRGYEIAEELCESAKKKAKSKAIKNNNGGQSRCAFDYYICQNGIMTTVDEDERRFKRLYCKPYIVNRNIGACDDCETLYARLEELNDELNKMSYGKAKQIRNGYEKGEDAVKMLFKKISSRLKKPLDDPFIDEKASYYDASTLIDFIGPISKERR